MAKRDRELWSEVSAYLQPRPGWSLLPMSTPGAPPTWCYRSGMKTTLQVSVDRGSICVYVMEDDREARFDSVEALQARLEGAGPVTPPGHLVADELEDLAHGRVLEWGTVAAEGPEERGPGHDS